MATNYRCDYCGATYDTHREICGDCGQYRIFDLVANAPTALYNHVGWEPRETMAEVGNAASGKKKFTPGAPGKESKDLKQKRTSPMQVDGRAKNRR